jgi:SAM-dependent methyltransferase
MEVHQQPRAEQTTEPPRYRSWVGPPHKYDRIGAMQFNLLTTIGLREHHYMLDIGCGSLRGGRLFIPYLLPGHYFGIEPEQWLVEEGLENELGRDIMRVKSPTFSHVSDFRLSVFDTEFDFILAQSIFTHASAPQISACLAETKKVLKTDGVMPATFFEGQKNYEGTEWVYPGGTRYRFEYLASLAADAGLDLAPLDWWHPNQQRWVLISQPDHPAKASGAEADSPALALTTSP